MNTTHNSSNTKCTNPFVTNEGLKVFLLLFYVVVMVLAILGNTFIIKIVFFNKSAKTSTNIYIVNMAVCDLGIPLFVLPKKIAELFVGLYVWLIPGEAGLALCKIVLFVQSVFIGCSAFSLLLISFDRFCAVLLPHKRHLLSTKVVIILISLTWFLSISISAIYLKLSLIYLVNGKTLCVSLWSSREAFLSYYIISLCITLIIPVLLITTASSAIFFKLKKQVLALGEDSSDHQRLQETLRQKKIIKMIFVIVFVFVLCCLPSAVTIIIQVYIVEYSVRYPCWFYIFSEISSYFLVVFSVTNPVICFIFGTIFREELCKICRRVFGRCFLSKELNITK